MGLNYCGKLANKQNLENPCIFLIQMDSQRSCSRSPTSKPKFGESPPSERLYLTFLPEDIEESKLRGVFEQVGDVNRVKIIKKDDGFTLAFLEMGSVEEAERAIQKFHRYKIGDKQIRVQFARERKTDDKSGQRGRDNNRDNRENKGGFREDSHRESDTRKRFEGGNDRGRGRGRGNGDFGDRGDRGDRFDRGGRGGRGDRIGGRGGRDRDEGGDREERRPMKCFKCQGEGHISKNCPGESRDGSNRGGRNDKFDRPKPRQPEKMSEDEFQDY